MTLWGEFMKYDVVAGRMGIIVMVMSGYGGDDKDIAS